MRATRKLSTLLLMINLSGASAEVMRDGSIGPGTTIQPSGPDYAIPQEMGTLRGANLFHSFARFDVSSDETVVFGAVDSVENLIARVTGDSYSSIDGAVGSDIPGVSLYLLNPHGFIVGPDAQIQVDGSLYIGAADHIGFGDGNRLDARNGGTPLLTSAPPAAFGFLGQDAGAIRVNGARLEVGPGRTLLLAGQDIRLVGEPGDTLLHAPSGEVAMFAVSSPGEVRFAPYPTENGFTAYGRIDLSTSDEEDGGAEAPVDPDDEADDEAGDAQPKDAQIDVSGDPAGRVSLVAEDILTRDFRITADTSGVLNAAQSGIYVRASGLVELAGESGFVSSSKSAGDGGAVEIRAREIHILDESELLSDALAGGGGGHVDLNADILRLDGDAEVATDAESSGTGGNVTIDVRNLILSGNSEISSDTDPDSSAQGGSVRIHARQTLHLDIEGDEAAGIFTNSEGSGQAGDITIVTPQLTVSGGVITAETSATGAGGRVRIDASQITLDRRGIISALSSGSFHGAGDAGDVSLEGIEQLTIRDGSGVVTRSSFSDGGNIAITANGLVQVRTGTLSANVNDGVGGNLDLTADTVVLHDAGVVAQAGAGKGGNIMISSRRFLNSESLISASAATGISGTVTIDSPVIDLGGGLAPATTEFLDASALLQAACAARDQADASSFVVATRRGLPAGQDGLPLERDGLVRNTAADLVTPDTLPWLQRSVKARAALKLGRIEPARAELEQIERGLEHLPVSKARVYAWLNWGISLLQLGERAGDPHGVLLTRVHRRLQSALNDAEALASARARSYASGNLALLYQSEGRTREALYLARLAQRAAEQANAPESLYRWHWLRGQLLWSQGQANAALDAYRVAMEILVETRQEAFSREADRDAFFRDDVAPVYLDFVNALLQSATRVGAESATLLRREARSVIEAFRAAELRDYFSDPCVTERHTHKASIDEMADQAVIVYPIIFPDRLELLVTLPSGITHYVSQVSADRLATEAKALRTAIQERRGDFAQPARRLYDWLIRPFADALDLAASRTLVMIPGGPLRGVPLSVLMDGDRFLLQDHALAVTPGLNLVDPRPLPLEKLPVLLAGVSEAVQGYSPLPGVLNELSHIQDLLQGRIMLDSAFSAQAFGEALREQQPGLVHIASHAHFGGRAQDNFVLAYDQHLDMADLSSLIGVTRYREQPLELLVLSACQTAVGDDQAVLGLAGVAVRAGARSALGSLWSIADEATAELMKTFYRELRKPGVSRAQALQQAQLGLLEQNRYRDPIFWSAFLMINNWL